MVRSASKFAGKILLALIFGLMVTAVSVRADSFDDYVREQMKARQIPAIVYGVFQDGKILRSGAYGLSNVELGVPANVDNVFEIGSVSKQFTATVALMLMEEGRLKLEDRIDKYLSGLPESWQPVTLSQLMSHTSGIPDIEEIFGYDSYREKFTVEQIIKVANSRPPDFAPGKGWHYSNTGYYLLGLVLEKILGKPYGQIMKERIFEPLGMTHTQESDPWRIIPNRAAGYQSQDKGIGNRDAMQPTACLGAGTLVSTIGDMAKWDAAINHNRLLKPETQKLMWTKVSIPGGEAPYGYGWFISPWRGHPSVEHSGGTAGYSCDYRRFHDLGLSVMVFSNAYATAVEDIGMRAVDRIHPGLTYLTLKPIADPKPAVREMLLKAMAEVAQGGDGSANVTPKMWQSYAPVSRTAWKERLAGMKGFELLRHETYPPQQTRFGDMVVETYVYRLKTGDQVLYINFQLTADGKIAFQNRELF